MRRTVLVFLLAASVTGLLATMPGLAGASTTIGETTDTPSACTTPSAALVRYQHTTGLGSPSYAVPAGGGVITAWTTNPGAVTGVSTRLEVIREAPGGGSPHTVVGESDLRSNIATHNAAKFATRIPVQGGDLIGLELQPPTAIPCVGGGAAGDLTVQSPDPGPGNDLPATSAQSPFRMDVAATVEADADHDGFGDESQDACPAVAGTVNGCPPADLAVTETASPNPSPVHGQFSYLVRVRNNGPSALPPAQAWVADTIGPGVTFISASSPGGACTRGAVIRCPVPELALGETSTITVSVRANAEGGRANAATVTYGGDTNPANNTAGVTAKVVPGPRVSAVSISPDIWRLGSTLPKFTRKRPIGTTISFRLSQPARPTLAFSQPATGRKVGKRCKTSTRGNRNQPRCTIPNVRGTLMFNSHAGTNKVRFLGRLSRSKRLKPGRYTLTVTAIDSAGNRSNAKTISFTVVR